MMDSATFRELTTRATMQKALDELQHKHAWQFGGLLDHHDVGWFVCECGKYKRVELKEESE